MACFFVTTDCIARICCAFIHLTLRQQHPLVLLLVCSFPSPTYHRPQPLISPLLHFIHQDGRQVHGRPHSRPSHFAPSSTHNPQQASPSHFILYSRTSPR